MPNYALVYQQMQALKKELSIILNSLHLQLSGEAVRSQALEKILLDKGVFTEEELRKKMTSVIEELNSTNNKKAETGSVDEEKEKPELIKPTTEEVAEIEKQKDSERKKADDK